jgi:hypothetical protein
MASRGRRYAPIERALAQFEQMGLDVRPEDIERIWPLGFQHINMLDRYSFDLPEQLTRGELRSLRDPSDAADEWVLVAQAGFFVPCYPRPNSERGQGQARPRTVPQLMKAKLSELVRRGARPLVSWPFNLSGSGRMPKTRRARLHEFPAC